MIEVKNLYKSFGDKQVLKNISATFNKGKTNLIIGQSGSGKTVLLKSLVGLIPITSGEIWYDNTSRFDQMPFSEKKEIRKQIGMLFQGSALFDFATVVENVMFPLEMFTDMSYAERRERADFCLKRVNILNADNLFPAEISGGMQKRVAIARAISLNPKYLFCDEPNSGLDPQTSIIIDNLIKEITEEYEITTLINTHDMNSVLAMGDKIIFIYKGEKWWEGNSDEILYNDNKEVNELVFASRMAQTLKKYITK